MFIYVPGASNLGISILGTAMSCGLFQTERKLTESSTSKPSTKGMNVSNLTVNFPRSYLGVSESHDSSYLVT